DYYVMSVYGLKNKIEIPVTEKMTSNIAVSISYFKNNDFVDRGTYILTPETDTGLKLKITPDKPDYEPRGHASFKIEAKYCNNKPATAQVTLGIVDDAIFQLYNPGSLYNSIAVGFLDQFKILYSKSVQTVNSEDYNDKANRNYFFDRRLKDSCLPTVDLDNPNAGKICFYEIPREYNAKANEYKGEIRFNFPDTCYFNPNIITDQNGEAIVHFELPDSLTTWNSRALAVTADSKFGEDQIRVTASKKVMARVVTPRFLTERDEAVITGIVHNNLTSEKNIAIELQAEGAEIISPARRETVVSANGVAKTDWKVKVNKPGKAKFTLFAMTDEVSDAEERTIPVVNHGFEKTDSKSGKTDTSQKLMFDLPQTCDLNTGEHNITMYSNLSVIVFPALDYLVNYHYGCTEQTMSRFLPLVITSRAYKNFKLTNSQLNENMPAIVREGLDRLYNYQHSDGGWGWWKEDDSSIWMTAYVVYGLSVASEKNYEIEYSCISNGKNWLNEHFPDANLTEKTYILYALSYAGDPCSKRAAELFKMKDKMNNYSLALLALILEKEKLHDEALSVLKTLEKKASIHDDTAHWTGDYKYYGWCGNIDEVTSFALMAFIKIEPGNPICARSVNYLLKNMKNGYWYSTRATAISVIAITDYIKTIEEPAINFSVRVSANNREAGYFEFAGAVKDGEPVKKLKLPAELLNNGKNEIELQKSGTGRLYYSMLLKYYDSDENLKPVNKGFEVKREYFLISQEKDEKGNRKLIPLEGKPIVLKSQDQILVKLTVKSEQVCQYMILEDPKPAGCEVLTSFTDHSWRYSGMEFRDEKTAFFASYVDPGTTTYEYRMIAETPGTFHAMPAKAWMMYTPGMEGSSAESIFVIEDKK
ncbi:MAG: hypothetical protein LWY06_14860, partial [Firmicutes bacterium]|nr:hypothetical protein [Bacillota bacterium]